VGTLLGQGPRAGCLGLHGHAQGKVAWTCSSLPFLWSFANGDNLVSTLQAGTQESVPLALCGNGKQKSGFRRNSKLGPATMYLLAVLCPDWPAPPVAFRAGGPYSSLTLSNCSTPEKPLGA